MASGQNCIDALRKAVRDRGVADESRGRGPRADTGVGDDHRTVGGWNDAKELAGLSTNASTGSRVGPPPDGIDDDVRERWTELSGDRRWHYRNRDLNTERTLKRRESLRGWLDEQAAEAGCERCGGRTPAVRTSTTAKGKGRSKGSAKW